MKLKEQISRIQSMMGLLNESEDERIVCDECGWSWNLSDGGDDPYTCHKCWHENEH
jgi:hypothetical protein